MSDDPPQGNTAHLRAAMHDLGVKLAEAGERIKALEDSTPTPAMIAAAWRAFNYGPGPKRIWIRTYKIAPGPAFVEAIKAALKAREG
jgi:hypothetical protein